MGQLKSPHLRQTRQLPTNTFGRTPAQYPVGESIFVTDAPFPAGNDFPEQANAVVRTSSYALGGRASQEFIPANSDSIAGRKWVRSSNGSTAWTPWRLIRGGTFASLSGPVSGLEIAYPPGSNRHMLTLTTPSGPNNQKILARVRSNGGTALLSDTRYNHVRTVRAVNSAPASAEVKAQNVTELDFGGEATANSGYGNQLVMFISNNIFRGTYRHSSSNESFPGYGTQNSVSNEGTFMVAGVSADLIQFYWSGGGSFPAGTYWSITPV